MSLGICLIAGAKTTKVAALAFTLSWTHSVQKTTWEEDWRITPAGLHIVEARVESSGAGMEPGDDARFDGRFWRWKPELPTLPELALRRSDAVPQGWSFCAAGTCRRVADAAESADIVRVTPCEM